MRLENRAELAQEAGRQQEFFKFIAEGEFAPEQIKVKETAGTLRRTEESEAWIENHWQAAIARGLKPWPNDTKPSRNRFVGAEQIGDTLEITVDPCVSYRDFIGSQMPEFREKFGPEFSTNALVSSTSLLAKNKAGEEHLALTLRNPSHDYKAGGYHASIGGYTAIGETPTQCVMREIEEESGLRQNEITSLAGQGIIYEPWPNTYAAIFRAETGVTVEDISQRQHDAENQIVFIPTERRQLQSWLLAPVHALTTAGVASLLTLGQYKYGAAWREKMEKALAWRSADYNSAEMRDQLEKRDSQRLAKKITGLS